MSFKRVILDIEANNFLENMLDFTQKPLKLKSTARIWCIVIRCIDTKESKMLIPPYILDNIDAYKRTADPEQVMKYSKLDVIPLTRESLKECLKDAEEFVAHSGIKYDLPALKYFDLLDYYIGYPNLNGINKFNNITTINGKETVITDTLLWSKLVNPDRFQHGLEYFGKLFGNQKIEFKAFHEFSIEMVNYCITPDMRLLDDNLTWRPASSFKVGETILGFDEENQSNRSGRRYKNSIIEIITPDKQEVFEVKLQSGKILKVTKEHRFLTCVDSSNGYTNYNWTMTKDLVFGQSNTGNSKLPCLLPVEEKLNSYDSGWLAGIFDGEGCLGGGNSRPPTLSVSQRPGIVLDKIENVLNQNNINFSKRYVNKINDCHSLKILDGLPSVYKTLSLFRPERLISKLDYDTFGRLELKSNGFKDEVVSVTSIGFQDILKIQTSTGTFMCEGYPMHNCHQDAVVNHDVYDLINSEKKSYEGWDIPYQMEAKLADLSLNQELFGFHYDQELSDKCKIELDQLLQERDDIVTPNIPPKPLNKGEQKQFTPPATKFSKSANRMSKHMSNFIEKIGAEYNAIEDTYEFEGEVFDLYYDGCVKKSTPSSIKDLAHVKGYLISLGWEPTEWSNRDLVKDSNKQFRDEEKFDKSLLKYAIETFEGPFKELRLEVLELPTDITQEEFIDHYKTSYLAKPTKSIYVPTSPPLRVGTDKELCPGLVKLSEEIPFAKDLAEYFTYSHRRNSISGNVDEESGEVGSGFESYVREDGRISTPVDTLGTNTSRMAHKVVNIINSQYI